MQNFSLLRSKLPSLIEHLLILTVRKSQDCLKCWSINESVPETSRCLILKIRSTSHKEFLTSRCFHEYFKNYLSNDKSKSLKMCCAPCCNFCLVLTSFFSLFTKNKLLSNLTLKYTKLIKKRRNYRVWCFLSSCCSYAVSWWCFALEIRSDGFNHTFSVNIFYISLKVKKKIHKIQEQRDK